MRPLLFEVWGIEFLSYMTFILIGFILAMWLSRREADSLGLPGDKVVDLGIAMLIFGVFGARIFSVLTDGYFMDFVHWCTDPKLVEAATAKVSYCTLDAQCGAHNLCNLDNNTCYPERDCLAAFKVWYGGLTYYGGFILAVPVGFWLARRWNLGAMRMADLGAPYTMIGLFFGRLGCFFNGCCYGGETSSFLGMTFPLHKTRPNVPIHPVQLYEAVAVLGIAAFLYYVIRPRQKGQGEVFGWLMILYSLWRFNVEWLRIDQRGSLGPLSTSQLISIPLIVLGGWLVWRARQPAAKLTE